DDVEHKHARGLCGRRGIRMLCVFLSSGLILLEFGLVFPASEIAARREGCQLHSHLRPQVDSRTHTRTRFAPRISFVTLLLRVGTALRKGCMVDGQMTQASQSEFPPHPRSSFSTRGRLIYVRPSSRLPLHRQRGIQFEG
ncbi:unnamed protein product, partial [Pylaiella littoralis]